MSLKSSNSPPSGDDAAASRDQVSLGPYISSRPYGRVRVVAPPDEQSRQVQAVIGVQVRQQDVHFAGIRVALQRTEYSAAEIDHQRGRVRCVHAGSPTPANQGRRHCRSSRAR